MRLSALAESPGSKALAKAPPVVSIIIVFTAESAEVTYEGPLYAVDAVACRRAAILMPPGEVS